MPLVKLNDSPNAPTTLLYWSLTPLATLNTPLVHTYINTNMLKYLVKLLFHECEEIPMKPNIMSAILNKLSDFYHLS